MSATDKQPHFEAVIRDNEPDVYRYFQRRIFNPADAAEAYGELLITAWKLHRKMPAEPVQARMWLFGVAHNVLRSSRRSAARQSAAVRRFVDELRTAPEPEREDIAVALQDAIGSLPAQQAELVRLVYWDGFTSQEAAEILGLNASTARSRMTKAREQLRSLLEPALPAR